MSPKLYLSRCRRHHWKISAFMVVSLFFAIIAALTRGAKLAGAAGTCKRVTSGPVPCSGARSAAGQGTGRSQRRDSARRSRAEQVIEQIRISSRPACYTESLTLWVRKFRNFPFYALWASSRANKITWPNNEVPRCKQRGITPIATLVTPAQAGVQKAL